MVRVERESAKERGRMKGPVPLLHYCISLDREEPSRSPTPATGNVVRYDELAERNWIHALGSVVSRLYTSSTPESDSEAAESERHSSPDQEIGGEIDSRRDQEMLERLIYDFNLIYKAAELAMYARVE
jgi:hypothetical protein